MELENNLREENLSTEICKKDELLSSFEIVASAKGNNYLQEFHHLDHQFHPIANSSSNNHVMEEENLCSNFDSLNNNQYSHGIDQEMYEFNYKGNAAADQVMDNFQNCGDYYYYCNNFHQRNHQIEIMGLERNSINIPLNFPEIKPVNFMVPDEVSSIASARNGHIQKGIINKNVNFSSLLRTSKGRKKPNVIKGQWTVEEDRLLVQLVEQYGVRKWSHIARMLPGRIGKQCRERWHNHLRPDIKKDTWSEEEDRVLIEAHSEIGNKWAEIAKRLPGRTENSIKNHWNATKRRQYSKRKCRSKYPRCSLLQDYIKSLNLDSNNAVRHQKKSSAAISSAVNNNTKSKSADHHHHHHHHQVQTTDFCPNDWTVPDFDFKEEPEFYLDDSFFPEGCSINSLMEDIVGASVDEANNYDRKRYNNNNDESVELRCVEMDKLQYYGPVSTATAAAGGMEFEVKKELDLVEMMSQVNEVNSMMK
ncbi:transcription factor MYB98-like [Cucumis melo var. makuwa]|uniref:Transcription factor MYB98-like n=2 Tax=Cucumis melo TaxID=3656 RepID=A0A9I9DE35_CUCME|nr:transcription factor MYB98-like [Cucumis melo]KAA0057864.1 transcription factor MYB98-like [Cucumis melo var. makuwa]TYJ98554.1 transcription factor MYB98-like [Cucumis melo var. makuwa]